MTDPGAEYAALLARAAPYLRRPAEVGEVGYGQVAVTADPWLRAAAEPYLQQGLPELPLSYDEQVDALVQALTELAAEFAHGGVGLRRAWDPAKHPRGPDGRFLSTVDSLKDAIRKHRAGGRGGDPFGGFDREQLRRAAKARGITLARGESRESIAAKLLADLDSPPVPTPMPRAARVYHRSLDGLEDLAALAAAAEANSTHDDLSSGKVGVVTRMTLPDGRVVLRKQSGRWGDYDGIEITSREQLTARVGQVLGAPIPRAYRDSPDTVYMDWVEGDVADNLFPFHDLIRAELGQEPQSPLLRAAVGSPEAVRIGLFDMLTHNTDRHTGNWMVSDNGDVHGIDHGLAWDDGAVDGVDLRWGQPESPFQDAADTVAWRMMEDLDGPFVRNFMTINDDDEYELVDNPLTPGDIQVVRDRLESLRDDFEHIGQERWLVYALRVLDTLEPHATGTESIFNG